MKAKNNIIIYVALVAASAIFLIIEHLTHIEFMLHVAAIPLEVLVVVFIVQIYLENRQKKERRHQLMHIKSCMFRLEMRNLLIADFLALKSPPLTISKIKRATLAELKKMREDANKIEYQSPEMMELVILEYVNAQSVWRNFMDIALEYGFEDIFQDMVYILHFISDVKTFKENNPGKMFIHTAAKNEILMQKVMKILGDGIRKYLDYAIELKEKQPNLFTEVISDYELSTQIRGKQVKVRR
jgi:hypothetical protein